MAALARAPLRGSAWPPRAEEPLPTPALFATVPLTAMTARERILTLLEGKPVDRPPAMPITMMWAADLIGAKYHDYATRAEVQAASQIAVATQFGFDHVSVISDPGCEAADLGAAIFYPPDAPPAIIEEQALLANTAPLPKLRVPDPHRAGSRMAHR